MCLEVVCIRPRGKEEAHAGIFMPVAVFLGLFHDVKEAQHVAQLAYILYVANELIALLRRSLGVTSWDELVRVGLDVLENLVPVYAVHCEAN